MLTEIFSGRKKEQQVSGRLGPTVEDLPFPAQSEIIGFELPVKPFPIYLL